MGSESTRMTPQGPVPVVSILRDYRKFGTVTMPSGLVQKLMGIEQVVIVNNYEYDTVPADAFELPAVIKALIK
jgi:hypothetical protein